MSYSCVFVGWLMQNRCDRLSELPRLPSRDLIADSIEAVSRFFKIHLL